MLKYAERYIEGNMQTPFANAGERAFPALADWLGNDNWADAAYVLSYSTIMLNTDVHNPQVKNQMTKNDFMKNNHGINDGANLPEELLLDIFDDIVNNEIHMKDEVDATLGQVSSAGPSIAGALVTVGWDLQQEAYMLQSSGMTNKTEVNCTLLSTYWII